MRSIGHDWDNVSSLSSAVSRIVMILDEAVFAIEILCHTQHVNTMFASFTSSFFTIKSTGISSNGNQLTVFLERIAYS